MMVDWRDWQCACLWQTEAGVASSDDDCFMFAEHFPSVLNMLTER
jgi:hypothetical protein